MFTDNSDFYPTPQSLINKMLNKIDFRMIHNVLEPSAGKGDIAEAVKQKFKSNYGYSYNSDKKSFDIDCIEIDENLQHILRGKELRIVHDNFLNYNSYKKYDVIIMNPPFSEGDKHLLKAIKMQETGGKIVCLLNAETLKNAYSNIRIDLLQQLEKYNANIEYIENAFTDAERKTEVETALIYIDIPKNYDDSIILDELRQEEQYKTIEPDNNNTLINNDFIKGIIEQYNFEVKTGLKLIAEYNALKPFMLSSVKESSNPILDLSLHSKDSDDNSTLENGYIKQLRMKYWKALFTSEQFMGLFTSNLKEKYYNKINELRNYDFSMYNIYTIKIQLNEEMIKGVEDTILNLFEELSNKHHWYSETSSNIHYYNGWKTNQAYKINKKVIIPLNCYSWSGSLQLTYGNVFDKLTDIEKVFNYLDNCLTEEIDIKEALKFAEHYEDTKKIELKYFYVTFYKKGTCHLEFKNLELLHKFNVFGSQRKNWLPPCYGKAQYKDMTEEEKTVINEFEGKESYNKVMFNKDYYIQDTSNLLMLTS